MCKNFSKIVVSFALFFVFAFGCLLSASNGYVSKVNFVGYKQLLITSSKETPSSLLEFFVDLFSPLFAKDETCDEEVKTNNETTNNNKRIEVYISGRPIGFSLSSSGVVVVEKSVVVSTGGEEDPLKGSDILAGDILIEIEGESVYSGADVVDKVNKFVANKERLSVAVLRGEKKIETTVKPALDSLTGTYRLGLWVRDNAVGVGTITYIDLDGNFCALGHPVTDIDTGVIIPVNDGQVFKCSIVGVVKGKRGVAGELRGLFLQSQNAVGKIDKNSSNGLFGCVHKDRMSEFCGQKMELAHADEIKIGKAKILTTVDGSEPAFYDIEIVKNNYVNAEQNKCMIIKVVDSALIEKTGGIVQGMSGSPIVQDGKLVGCVTHVFINDPTKGFADFIKQ